MPHRADCGSVPLSRLPEIASPPLKKSHAVRRGLCTSRRQRARTVGSLIAAAQDGSHRLVRAEGSVPETRVRVSSKSDSPRSSASCVGSVPEMVSQPGMRTVCSPCSSPSSVGSVPSSVRPTPRFQSPGL